MLELLFEAATPLGFRVRVERSRWELISEVKHPVMRGQEALVFEALTSPDEIRVSQSDETVLLFYKIIRQKRWVCAVAKRRQTEGFLITAYPTDAIKEGTSLWKK